jgi:D-beta-D-heptose 7-phosphate kinase/D-beta-D-heptose 1-phosphate adenosyltransferase
MWTVDNILVVGDAMLDCYYWGEVNRISPEAPVPVVTLKEITHVLGGAANVAANVMGMGFEPILVGLKGKDAEGQILSSLLSDHGITDYLAAERERPTTTKTRIVSGGQHMLRIDMEDTVPMYIRSGNTIRSRIKGVLSETLAIIISDYAKGAVSEQLACDVIQWGKQKDIPVFVDPKGWKWNHYGDAWCITPNRKEFVEFYHKNYGGNLVSIEEIEAVASTVAYEFNLAYLCVTLGEHGILVANMDEVHVLEAETVNAVDVSGAGDTVIAALATGVAGIEDPCDVDMKDMKWVVRYANKAAAIAVSKLGTVPVSLYEVDYD